MRDPPLILIVDDNADNREILEARLASQGYRTALAIDGEEGLQAVRTLLPDLVLLDVMMPKLDGFEVTRQLRADSALPYIPIVLVTAKVALQDVVHGLDLGADEYLTKPVEHAALVARVRATLRAKALHDEVRSQAAELEEWNRTLEERVSAQLAEIQSLGSLKRFLAPQVAELIMSTADERLLDSHRREITVVFCDLRGFTAFAEMSEPEEVIGILRQYHEALGKLIFHFEGTLERFVGDGVVVVFNDPLPCTDPCARAVRMAIEMRGKVSALSEEWRRHGHELGFGVGIAHGYATLGRVGFEGRFEYTAIGPVPNLASRLCDQAADGDILLSRRALALIEDLVEAEPVGDLTLKGFARPVAAYRVHGLRQ